MMISYSCIRGFMSKLPKKSWMVSIKVICAWVKTKNEQPHELTPIWLRGLSAMKCFKPFETTINTLLYCLILLLIIKNKCIVQWSPCWSCSNFMYIKYYKDSNESDAFFVFGQVGPLDWNFCNFAKVSNFWRCFFCKCEKNKKIG